MWVVRPEKKKDQIPCLADTHLANKADYYSDSSQLNEWHEGCLKSVLRWQLLMIEKIDFFFNPAVLKSFSVQVRYVTVLRATEPVVKPTPVALIRTNKKSQFIFLWPLMSRQQTLGDKINEGQKWQLKRMRGKHFISMTRHISVIVWLELLVCRGGRWGEGVSAARNAAWNSARVAFCLIDCGNNDTWLCWGGCWMVLDGAGGHQAPLSFSAAAVGAALRPALIGWGSRRCFWRGPDGLCRLLTWSHRCGPHFQAAALQGGWHNGGAELQLELSGSLRSSGELRPKEWKTH